MALTNEITPFVRSCVRLWLADTILSEFTVADLITDLKAEHVVLEDIDTTKAVSNELIRLENKHKLASRVGVRGVDGCGVGRPPRVYTIKVKFLK